MSIVEMKVPPIGESINEVTLSQWLKGDGDIVKLDEPICEFESDKATLEFPAEAAGKLIYVAAEGDDLEIGALVAKIDTSAAADDTSDAVTDKGIEKESETQDESKVAEGAASYAENHPSPAAAKMLAESGIEAKDVKGTGKGGRITKEDAQQAIEAATKSAEAQTKSSTSDGSTATAGTETPVTSTPFSREESRKKMSRMRRTIAARLVSAKNTTAMLTTFNEVDLSAVMALRKKHQERFVDQHGIKLGFMSLFAKACAKVLMEMPQVNARLDENELVYHDYVDISIAISTDNGLVVPPVRNVESLPFHAIELKIKELASKARAGSLSLDEMRGGTFTITNGGIFGSMLSTPILNEPQSAILGMHNIIQRPVVVDGEIVVRPMMYLALSYDHRVIDGSSSVTFLVKVKQLLEDPVLLML